MLTRLQQGRASTGSARASALIAALVGLCVLTSCGTSQDADVSQVARHFYIAVQEGDGQDACQMLSPASRSGLEKSSRQKCSQAIITEDLDVAADVESAQVYGTMAIVHTDEDTMFLSRFSVGWQITGVGCQPTGRLDQYDCSITGG